MSVHKALALHAEKQNKIFKEFLDLDEKRERYIEEAMELCKQGKPFSTNNINEVTNKINQMTMRIIPTRKIVTIEMVMEYVKKVSK